VKVPVNAYVIAATIFLPTLRLPMSLPVRLSALLGLALLLAGCATQPPPPNAGMALPPDYDYPDRDTVRVATWNLEHFVDGHDNPYISAGREDDPPAALDKRVDRVVKALRQMDADLVVLQEAESEAFLQQIAREELGDLGYRFATSTESPSWYMNVVLLSRYPLGVVRNYADVITPIAGQQADNGEPAAQSLTNHRLWMADVRLGPSQTWTVVGAHLKAGRSAEDRGWRIGQIRFLHTELARLTEDRPDANVLVAGDLNALADSPELRLLLNNPSRPAPDSLTTADTPRRVHFTDPLAGRPTYTHSSDDPSRQLDYLLPNTALANRLVDGSMQVAQPLAPDSMAATSDHLPVEAAFVQTGK
jgi:endonuclease/exonuclease/phosphatase family metal-dependent hydrolase